MFSEPLLVCLFILSSIAAICSGTRDAQRIARLEILHSSYFIIHNVRC